MFSTTWFSTDYELYKLFAVILFIMVSLMVSNYTHKKGLISPESNRRLVHTFIGIIMSFSTIIFSSKFFPLLMAISFILINTIAFKSKIFPGIHSQKRKSYGTIYFPLSYFIIIYFFWENSQFVILSLLILTISDPIAAQIGSKKESLWQFKIWHDYKTASGTIAFFTSSCSSEVIVSFGDKSGFKTITAFTASPHFSSGTPTTIA